jgi:hypothetical protein
MTIWFKEKGYLNSSPHFNSFKINRKKNFSLGETYSEVELVKMSDLVFWRRSVLPVGAYIRSRKKGGYGQQQKKRKNDFWCPLL